MRSRRPPAFTQSPRIFLRIQSPLSDDQIVQCMCKDICIMMSAAENQLKHNKSPRYAERTRVLNSRVAAQATHKDVPVSVMQTNFCVCYSEWLPHAHADLYDISYSLLCVCSLGSCCFSPGSVMISLVCCARSRVCVCLETTLDFWIDGIYVSQRVLKRFQIEWSTEDNIFCKRCFQLADQK